MEPLPRVSWLVQQRVRCMLHEHAQRGTSSRDHLASACMWIVRCTTHVRRRAVLAHATRRHSAPSRTCLPTWPARLALAIGHCTPQPHKKLHATLALPPPRSLPLTAPSPHPRRSLPSLRPTAILPPLRHLSSHPPIKRNVDRSRAWRGRGAFHMWMGKGRSRFTNERW